MLLWYIKNDFCLVNSRIYLPKRWTEDAQRCDRAGIPIVHRTHKTKPQLALDMVLDAHREGIKFDWIGGDAVYGNSPELVAGIEELGAKFVLDVNGDKHIFLQQPELIPPQPSKGQGRPRTVSKIKGQAVSVLEYAQDLDKSQWKMVKIRKTPKGWLKAWCHVVKVWVVPRKTSKIQQRTLILRKVPKRKKAFKYSLSNIDLKVSTRATHLPFL